VNPKISCAKFPPVCAARSPCVEERSCPAVLHLCACPVSSSVILLSAKNGGHAELFRHGVSQPCRSTHGPRECESHLQLHCSRLCQQHLRRCRVFPLDEESQWLSLGRKDLRRLLHL